MNPFTSNSRGTAGIQFTYFLNSPRGTWEPLFSLTVALPVGSIGMIKEEVAFMTPDPPISREEAMRVARTFIVPEDLGTPPGALALRAATNFQTPPGWDTVYTAVLNMIERPAAPVLVVRVETDWYAHETEFRYVLQPGEGISATHSMPIGQVFFVPREEITLRDCTEEELQAINQSAETFSREKAALQADDRLRIGVQPSLPPPEPFTENLTSVRTTRGRRAESGACSSRSGSYQTSRGR